jgi:hypothetical protein
MKYNEVYIENTWKHFKTRASCRCTKRTSGLKGNGLYSFKYQRLLHLIHRLSLRRLDQRHKKNMKALCHVPTSQEESWKKKYPENTLNDLKWPCTHGGFSWIKWWSGEVHVHRLFFFRITTWLLEGLAWSLWNTLELWDSRSKLSDLQRFTKTALKPYEKTWIGHNISKQSRYSLWYSQNI